MKLGSYITLKDKLNKDYLEKFEFIEHYGEIRNISVEAMAEKMMDLMDMMLQSQEKGFPPEHVTGKKIEDFCKTFFSDISAVDFLKNIIRRLRNLCMLVFVLELLWLSLDIGKDGFSIFTHKTDVSGYFVGIAIAWGSLLITDLISAVMTRMGKYSKKMYIGIATVCMLLSLAVPVIIFVKYETIDMEIYSWLPIFICGGYLLIYYAAVFIYRYKKTGSIRKTESAYETNFTGLLKSEIKKTDYSKDKFIVKTFAKRYNKKNSKRLKKGLSPMTTEEFFIWENKRSKYATYIGFLIGLLITVPFCGFESIADFAFFLSLMAVICLLLIWVMKKFEKITFAEQKAILKACQRCNTELDEYCNMLLSDTLPEDTADN